MYLKTLASIAKQRQTIPVLNTILIRDGFAVSTDMDIQISAPVTGFSNADGDEDLTFHAHGFDKGIFIKSCIPSTDFPEISGIGKGKLALETVIEDWQMEAFRWVMLAQSREATRYYLNGVYFDSTGIIVATDGHRLHSFKHKMKTKGKKKHDGFILPRHAAKIISDLMKETKAEELSIQFFDNNIFQCKVDGVVVDGKLVDGTLQDYNRVVPTTDPKNKTTLKKMELKTIIPELDVVNKISGIRRPAISIKEGFAFPTYDDTSQKFKWPVSVKLPFTAGFNLKYLLDIGSGEMEFIDSSSPFKITNNKGGIERLAVIMPMRV